MNDTHRTGRAHDLAAEIEKAVREADWRLGSQVSWETAMTTWARVAAEVAQTHLEKARAETLAAAEALRALALEMACDEESLTDSFHARFCPGCSRGVRVLATVDSLNRPGGGRR